jgi:hypothetical protein
MNSFGIGKLKPMPLKNQLDLIPDGGSDLQTLRREEAKREVFARVRNTKLAKLGMEGKRNTTVRSQRYERPMSRSAVHNGQFYGSPMEYSVTAGGLRGGVISTKEGQQWLAERLKQRINEYNEISSGNFTGPPQRISLQPNTDELDTVLQQVFTTFDTGAFTSAFMDTMNRLQNAFLNVGAMLTPMELGRYSRIIQKLYETIRSYSGQRQSGLFADLASQEDKVRTVSYVRKVLEQIGKVLTEVSRVINEDEPARKLVMSRLRELLVTRAEGQFSPSFASPSILRNIEASASLEPGLEPERFPFPPSEPPTSLSAREEEMNRRFPPYIPEEERANIDRNTGLGRGRR